MKNRLKKQIRAALILGVLVWTTSSCTKGNENTSDKNFSDSCCSKIDSCCKKGGPDSKFYAENSERLFSGKTMITIPAALGVKVLTGNAGGYYTNGNWTLSGGFGGRTYDTYIKFGSPSPFTVKPEIQIGITMLDIDQYKNTRVNTQIINSDKDGFTLRVSTWWDSAVYGTSVNWIAIGY